MNIECRIYIVFIEDVYQCLPSAFVCYLLSAWLFIIITALNYHYYHHYHYCNCPNFPSMISQILILKTKE